jgi:hypothetical protein
MLKKVAWFAAGILFLLAHFVAIQKLEAMQQGAGSTRADIAVSGD